VEHDLVLLLGDLGAVRRLVDVGLGDRLPLDVDLLVLDGDRRLHVLGDDALAQPHAAPLPAMDADPQLLLGAGHRLVGRRARRVVAHRTRRAGRVRVAARVPGGAGGRRRALGRVGDAVVLEELLLLLLGELAVGLDARGVPDLGLAHRHLDVLAGRLGAVQRNEGVLGPEEAGADQRPFGVAARVVIVDLADLADLLALGVDERSTSVVVGGCDLGHAASSKVGQQGHQQ
jgi:hypothetical protein